ncbi:MAG TPA: hypothetical protein VLS88_18990, partial [Polyangiales bacterium]|nr:hypothetical protein [Polyangiales bacterium]
VAFADFREFSWDVYLSVSSDGGETFEAANRINPAARSVVPVSGGDPVESERIHGDVALTVGPDGRAVVAWTERQDRRYESRVRVWRAGASSRADDAPELVDAWRPSLATNAAGDVVAVWQDLRNVTNGIRFATGTGASIAFEASARVDDPAADAHSFGPQIARLGDRIMVVWEDTRSGYARARLVTSD